MCFHQSFIRIFKFVDGDFKCLDGDLLHSHRPHWLFTGQNFSQNYKISVKGTAEKILFKNLAKSLLYSDNFRFVKAILGLELWVFQSSLVPSLVTLLYDHSRKSKSKQLNLGHGKLKFEIRICQVVPVGYIKHLQR